MKHFKQLLIASCLWLTAMSAYGMSSYCGLAYVVPAGTVTFFNSVEWSGYEIIIVETDIDIHVQSEVVSPFYASAYTHLENSPYGSVIHYVPNPPDGWYEGGGTGVIDAGFYGQDGTNCWNAGELDTLPAPTVSLSLSPNPAIVGDPVAATWSSTGATNCSWNNGDLPSTSGTGQLLSSALESDAGNYWVLCAASDGDTAQADVQLDVWECDDPYSSYIYEGDSEAPSPDFPTLIQQDPYELAGLSDMDWTDSGALPASCESYCVSHERKYRIVGFVFSGSDAFISIATKVQDSAVCVATDRTQSKKDDTTEHENIHASQWIDTINYSNNLIKGNPTYDNFEDCMEQATFVNVGVELADINELIDQDGHVNHSGLPQMDWYCDAGVTVEVIDAGTYP